MNSRVKKCKFKPKTRRDMGKNVKNGQKGKVLKTVKIELDTREPNEAFVSLDPKIHNCQDYIPIIPELLPLKLKKEKRTISSDYTLKSWEPETSNKNKGKLTCINKEGQEVQLYAYKKIMPLITPYRWMRYKERALEPFIWELQKGGVTAPVNQAYIDIMTSSLVSKLTKLGIPHYCDFYGAYRGRAEVFMYNLEDDIEDFRFSKWFWEEVESGRFGLCIIDKKTGQRLTLDECKELLKPDDSLLSDSDSNSDSDSESESESESESDSIISVDNELPTVQTTNNIDSDLKSVNSFSTEGDSIHLTKKRSESDASDSSIQDDYTVHAELAGMPVAVLFLEAMNGTMDDLLEEINHVTITPLIEQTWNAWIFQICAALTNLQYYLQLTHNDLHTNNIVWKKTDEEFLWYKSENRTWKVPTYGKIFYIIDYGRAIFSLNGHLCISSDYEDENDAAGQYNFGPLEVEDEPRVPPNRSFDLSRFACSVLRTLYPRNPPALEKGKPITKYVSETSHVLFNHLWTWLCDKNGDTILEDDMGEERYPGFELYVHIAADVKNAVPCDQFKTTLFTQFLVQTPLPSVRLIPLPL
jgi:hypothetical protein